MKQPEVTITLSDQEYESLMDVLERAFMLRSKPAGWRESEYVMTKTSMAMAIESLRKQDNSCGDYVLSFFDWGVLQGEIARLYFAVESEGEKETVLKQSLFLSSLLKQNTRFDKAVHLIEEQDKARKEMEKAQEVVEVTARRMWELQRKVKNLHQEK